MSKARWKPDVTEITLLAISSPVHPSAEME